jgi:hypothetical protein
MMIVFSQITAVRVEVPLLGGGVTGKLAVDGGVIGAYDDAPNHGGCAANSWRVLYILLDQLRPQHKPKLPLDGSKSQPLQQEDMPHHCS